MQYVSDFDYDLPKHFIAQQPIEPRDHSKLLVLDGTDIHHRLFFELTDYFEEGNVVVLNDTRVLPARLPCRKSTGGRVELLVMNLAENQLENKPTGKDPGKNGGCDIAEHFTTECLVKGKIREGIKLKVENLPLKARVEEHIEEGRYFVTFTPDSKSPKVSSGESFKNEFIKLMEQAGELPLPPYIKNPEVDTSRYQTIFSAKPGSIAAPTAGLHFTKELISKMERKGVKFCYITLHISYGTFKPVRVEQVNDHKMDIEYYQVSEETAEVLNEARKDRDLTAVGTTSVRTLEAVYRNTDTISACEGTTDIFIYPGFEFKSGIDRLITNFHFPRSTLLMLVSAFAGQERLMKAYEAAKDHRYRFYSFGDAMLIQQPGL
ncbi:MAG: tRNA preQ1(34) S-adenosylmethionine ribosyltransferase-isomerase QueA [Thermoplasmata archaeon]|nr:MAG: tRNA preQ1(34) S-adenosylmethionine ribosyltransferase-isomerase QueA [Thermoplasmata archaeon]